MAIQSQSANLATVFARGAYIASATPYREIIDVAGTTDGCAIWACHQAGGVASFQVYASNQADLFDALDELDPAVNKYWTPMAEFGAVFNRNPADALGNGVLWLSPNPGFHFLLVEMLVTTDLVEFDLFWRGQARAG